MTTNRADRGPHAGYKSIRGQVLARHVIVDRRMLIGSNRQLQLGIGGFCLLSGA